MSKILNLYIDTYCPQTTGPSGIGAIATDPDGKIVFSIYLGYKLSTLKRMQFVSLIKTLNYLIDNNYSSDIKIFSYSPVLKKDYIEGLQKLIESDKTSIKIKNEALIRSMLEILNSYNYNISWHDAMDQRSHNFLKFASELSNKASKNPTYEDNPDLDILENYIQMNDTFNSQEAKLNKVELEDKPKAIKLKELDNNQNVNLDQNNNGDIYIFTDGSCLGNGASSSANGGIGIIIKQGSKELVRISKGYTNTTNNRMEMLAFIEALKYLKEHSKAHLKINMCLDSQYVLKGTTEWLQGWKKKNWKNSAKKDVLNKDLWMQIDTLVYQEDIGKNIHWDWVKGHNGHIENEICDELAKAGAHNPTQKDQ